MAPFYGSGLSDRRIGSVPRGQAYDAILSSKVGRMVVPAADAPREQHPYADVLPFVQRRDFSYDRTLRSIEDTLQRLGVGRLNLACIHDIDRATHGDAQPDRFTAAVDGAGAALTRSREEGSIEGFGLGVNDWSVCVDALQSIQRATSRRTRRCGRVSLAWKSSARLVACRCRPRHCNSRAATPP